MDDHEVLQGGRMVADAARVWAAESEKRRCLAPAVVSALRASGLPRVLAPTALGGMAAHPGLVVQVVEEVARADGSAGWCVGIGLGSNYLAGVIPEESAREVFGELDRPAAGPFEPGGRATVTDSGYRLSGRWRYASGCRDAAVSASGFMVAEGGRPSEFDADGSPIIRLAFLTEDQFTIDETWDTVGMRGTGSHDIIATEIELPRERTGTLWDPMWPDDAIYRMRAFDVLGPCLAAVPLGIARAALDLAAATAQDQQANPPRPGPRQAFGDDPLAQIEFAKADIRVRSARLFLLDAIDRSYQHAHLGDEPPRVATAMIGLACIEAMRAGVATVEVACALAGSGSIRTNSALDRLRRDIHTAQTHVMFSPRLAAGLGRQAAGLDTIVFPFLSR